MVKTITKVKWLCGKSTNMGTHHQCGVSIGNLGTRSLHALTSIERFSLWAGDCDITKCVEWSQPLDYFILGVA